MTTRRIDSHEECLKSFANALKREVRDNLTAWNAMNHEQAVGRRMAFKRVEDEREVDLAHIAQWLFDFIDKESPEFGQAR